MFKWQVSHALLRLGSDLTAYCPSGLPWLPDRATDRRRAGVQLGGVVRAMTHHDNNVHVTDSPTGLAFPISDLLLLRGWADRYDIIMTIELDHRVDGEDCEELIAFRTDVNSSSFLLIWRDAEAIFVQPLVGRKLRFTSVSHLLERLVFAQPAGVTDAI
jgi:hypothetical protein